MPTPSDCPASVIMEHVERLSNIEAVQGYHERSITTLTTAVDAMSKQFSQIKWCVIGMASLYVLQEIGVITFLKGLLT